MLKKLMITTAVTALMVGSAVAQGSSSTPAPAAKPAPAAPAAPAAKSTEMSKPAANTAGAAKFINSQQSDQFLASKFKGTDVLGADNQKIGDVSDILFDKSGKILAYVVSVGGFLGINAKQVALEPAAFEVVAGDKSKNEYDKLKVSMSKDDIKQAANFEPYKAPVSTTGMGSGGPLGASRRPAPAMPR